MIGLIVLFILGLYLFFITIIAWFSIKLARSYLGWTNRLGNIFLGVIIFSFLCILPTLDEQIGKYQFNHLCKKLGMANVDINIIKNKKINIKYLTKKTKKIPYKFIPIEEIHYEYYDMETGKLLFSSKGYYASGGILSRSSFGLGTTNPLLGWENSCHEKIPDFNKLNSVVISERFQ